MEYNDFWLMLCDEGKVRKCAAFVRGCDHCLDLEDTLDE